MTPTSEYRTISLTHGLVAIVDVVDYERVSQFTWYAQRSRGKDFYAFRATSRAKGMKRRLISMHRFVLGAEDSPLHVDHLNHNTLDNRKLNLRLATNQQNHHNMKLSKANKSGFKGVYWQKDMEKFAASIKLSGEKIMLGYFPEARDAALAYDAKAKELFGEFAFLNFP